jgi:hypothetical protein
MSTQWRCAVCETVNDDGETCAACGAPRSEAATAVTPPAEAPRQPVAPEEVPIRELPVRSQPEREHEPPQYGTDDLRDFFDVSDVYRADDSYEDVEMIDTRPRIRVYGCCLPLALGILLAVAATLTGGAALLLRVF